jgi:hypothetical protein
MIFVDWYLPCFREQLITHPLSAFLPFHLCLLKVSMEISSLPFPPSPGRLQHPALSAVCSFSVPCLLFSFWGFFVGRGLSQWWLGKYHVLLIYSPVRLLNVSQAGLELVSGGVGALLFSQCNVA